MTHITTIDCPWCASVTCNFTIEELGVLIVASIRKRTIHCNSCGYTKTSLIIHAGEICTETKLPDEEDTELEYKYLGKDKF